MGKASMCYIRLLSLECLAMQFAADCNLNICLSFACDCCRLWLPLTSTLHPSARPPPTMMEAACSTGSACPLALWARLATAWQMAPAISLLFALARLALHSPMPWIPQLWLTLLVTSLTLVSPFTLPPVCLLLRIKATAHYIGIAVFAGFKIEVLSVAVSFVVQIPSTDQQDSLRAGCPDVVMSDIQYDLLALFIQFCTFACK